MIFQIIDSTKKIIHEGEENEMRKAFEYMTIDGCWKLAEKYGYGINELNELNKKYWVKFTGELKLVEKQ